MLKLIISNKENKIVKHAITLFLSVGIIISSPLLLDFVFATTSFSSEINLSNTDDTLSFNPQIVASGSNVYVIWEEGLTSTKDIFFNASSNSGSSFISGASINLSPTATDAEKSRIAASGSNVYVVWRDDAATDDIIFKRSTDAGANFEAKINISGDGDADDDPQIATSGTNVYVVWEDGASPQDISFKRNTGSGAAVPGFVVPSTPASENLSSDGNQSIEPQIAAAGNNVYVVWKDVTSSTDRDIFFRASTDGGDNFAVVKDLTADTRRAVEPYVAAAGDNVYVVYRNETSGITAKNIAFTGSTDKGATFSTPKKISPDVSSNIANNPQVAALGDNVYITWRDNTNGNQDVYFTVSTDKGATFSTPINLSSNSGISSEPKLNATGTNVSVTWINRVGSDDEIFYRSSINTGSSFCGTQNLSGTTGDSDNVALASAGNNVFIVWNDDKDDNAAKDDIFFRAGSVTSTCVEFDASEYRLSETATITVTSPSSNTDDLTAESLGPVTITSDTDSTGITLTLTETGANTGIFTGTMTFTTGSSSGTSLKAKAGDTLTASFGGATGTANIFSKTISLSSTTPKLDTIVTITITDQNSNTDDLTAESLGPVTVTSDTDSTGITLTLTETGANTGIFTNTGLVFMTGNDFFPLSGTISLRLEEPLTSNVQNADTNAVDQIAMTVISSTDGIGITPTLTETGKNTGIFTTKITFTSNTSSGNSLETAAGDVVSLTFLGETTRGIVTPNPDAGLGGIQAVVGDTITVSFSTATPKTATINIGSGGGGGGGGIVRPSLVLDIIASLAGGGGGAAPIVTLNDLRHSSFIDLPDEIEQAVINFDPFTPLEPFDVTAEQFETFDFPLSIDNDGYALSGHSNTIFQKRRKVSLSSSESPSLMLV